MTAGRNNTPAWMPQLIAALATVASVWGLIRTEVPTIVHTEVQAVMAEERMYMAMTMDSAWNAAQDSLHVRIEQEASAVRDSLQATLDLVKNAPAGTVTYSPEITVLPDTSGNAAMLLKMDSVLKMARKVLERPEPTPATPTRKGSRKGSDGWHH